jgi:DNA-binding transcriptional MerR regulator
MDQTKNLYTIQQVSYKLEIPKSTLRFWEKELNGLITPHRTEGGQRRYTNKNISIIEEVKRLSRRGIPLAEIERIHNNPDIPKTKDQKKVEILAHKLGKVIRDEIYKFYHQNNDNIPFF